MSRILYFQLKHSWQLPSISIYKTYPISKNSTDIAGEITAMPVFYFGFEYSKSNGDKFLYLTGGVLQSWAAL